MIVRTTITNMNHNQTRQMIFDNRSPCELILKVGSNEYDDISTAINSLLRSCSLTNQTFVFIERQIQPTTYFNSFTIRNSRNHLVPCQSLSCVLFLTDDLIHNLFQSKHFWNFHHKIELLDELKQTIARQDYYELSRSLPLWSVSHIPNNRKIIVRFNVFTTKFDLMLQFYINLFQRQPDSSKIGFVLFNLNSPMNKQVQYQLSIKYSPSIQSYSISQSAYLKFYLHKLTNFIQDYSRKLFTINQYEYYIYDPDGNLLHLCLQTKLSLTNAINNNNKECFYTNDSGVGDSSEPSIHLFNSTIPKIHSLNTDYDDQSHSSNDSGQFSSISSNELHKNQQTSIPINYLLKQQQQQQRTVFPFLSQNAQISKNNDSDISYNVDSPYQQSGYLNAFLLKKKQSDLYKSCHVKKLIAQFEKSNLLRVSSRPKSAPLSMPKSIKPFPKLIKPIPNRFLHTRSKSVTFDNENNEIDRKKTNNRFIQMQSPRINIGITLDSRLRKTPVLDMLRSTTMENDIQEQTTFKRSNSLKHSFIPIARF